MFDTYSMIICVIFVVCELWSCIFCICEAFLASILIFWMLSLELGSQHLMAQHPKLLL
jgi:hypothetical protein